MRRRTISPIPTNSPYSYQFMTKLYIYSSPRLQLRDRDKQRSRKAGAASQLEQGCADKRLIFSCRPNDEHKEMFFTYIVLYVWPKVDSTEEAMCGAYKPDAFRQAPFCALSPSWNSQFQDPSHRHDWLRTRIASTLLLIPSEVESCMKDSFWSSKETDYSTSRNAELTTTFFCA